MTDCGGCKFKQVNGKERCNTNKICCQRKGSKLFHKALVLDEDSPDYNPDLECALKEPYSKDWIKDANRISDMGHCALCYYHMWVEKNGAIVDICELDGLSTETIITMSDPERKKANHFDNKCPQHKMKMTGRR
jgi:hypothetical protein